MEEVNNLFLYRTKKGSSSCTGELWLEQRPNGTYLADTLEDKDLDLDNSQELTHIQKLKQFGKTAIPTGRYSISLIFSPKFKKIVPMLNNVKGFSKIYIHAGNSSVDTLGCILVGVRKTTTWIEKSRATINRLLNQFKSIFGIEVKKDVKNNFGINSLVLSKKTNITIIRDYGSL